MKRPQGFEHRPAPRPPAAPRPERPGTSGPAATPKTPRTPRSLSKSSAPTEPITIPPAEPAGLAPVVPLRPADGGAATGPGLTSPHEPGATPSAGPLTPRAARSRLRGARRARKQYERDEVRRFTGRSRRRRTNWFIALGTLVALVGFVLAGAYSPLMALRTIEVVGANRVPVDQVTAALKDQLGTPLPLVDLAAVRKDLSRFRLIRSYAVESRPPGTLVVRIVEREPIGVIPSRGGFDLVDAAGVVILSGDEPQAGYPAVAAEVGSPGFAAAAAVVESLPAGIRARLVTVAAATKDDVTLTLDGGARVVWGSAEESDYKAVVLAALMVGHPAGDVDEYDVSSPDSAVLR